MGIYKKIMVPLDGSKLAECVLPHVESVASGCHVPVVVLIQVIAPSKVLAISEPTMVAPEDKLEKLREEIEEQAIKDSREYLLDALARINLHGAEPLLESIIGKMPETLTRYAAEHSVDLIIMATHGRSGISRAIWGSVADRVLRTICVPVMLVRAPGCGLEFQPGAEKK